MLRHCKFKFPGVTLCAAGEIFGVLRYLKSKFPGVMVLKLLGFWNVFQAFAFSGSRLVVQTHSRLLRVRYAKRISGSGKFVMVFREVPENHNCRIF